MKVTRREFLKLVGAAIPAIAAGSLSTVTGCAPVRNIIRGVKKFQTQCPVCPMGCGIVVHMRKGIPFRLEGDKEHPLNEGSLCSRAYGILSYFDEKYRVGSVKYRKPFSSAWETLSWDKALSMIAERVKSARDASFVQFDGSLTVNRTEGIAACAGSSLTNEEAYLFAKFCRLVGISHIATEQLLRGGRADEAMNATYGLAGSTNPWVDIENSDTILLLGTNPSRNSPVVMRHIVRAQERGAKLLLVDPVATESASSADIHCPIIPGTDAIFLLGIANYAMTNDLVNQEYLSDNTDAPFFLRTDALVGGSGVRGDKADYDRDERGNPKKDDELRSVRTIFHVFREKLSVYTPRYVSEKTGCPVEIFLSAAEAFASTGLKQKSGSIIFGSAINSSYEIQGLRAANCVQLLLGNIGISGGGVYYQSRGANGLGVSYQIPSWESLPGGVPLPTRSKRSEDSDFNQYLKNNAPASNDLQSTNQWQHLKKIATSLLKAWYGETASAATRFDFDWLPKATSPMAASRWLSSIEKGTCKGAFFLAADLFSFGLSSRLCTQTLAGLDWLVATDFIHSDTTDFWNNGILNSGKIKTEVFLLPGLSLLEKQGTITASDRWTTWIEPVGRFKGEAQSELWMIDRIFQSVKSAYKSEGVLPEPIQYASWNTGGADPDTVLDEMSGKNLLTGKQISEMDELLADGNTLCGNILYSGINKRNNLAKRRKNDRGYSSAGIYPSWGWSVPSNVRILYNRAALDKQGTPTNGNRAVASADGSFRASDRIYGDGSVGIHPFIMNRDGVGCLFASDLAEEAFPFFAFVNPLMKKSPPGSSRINALCSAFAYYNLSRISPLVNETSLSGVCELSKELAAEKRIKNGGRVRVTSQTGSAFFTAVISLRGKKSSSEWICLRGELSRALFLSLPFEHTIVPVDIASAPLKEEKTR